jgi:hypothetical protein
MECPLNPSTPAVVQPVSDQRLDEAAYDFAPTIAPSKSLDVEPAPQVLEKDATKPGRVSGILDYRRESKPDAADFDAEKLKTLTAPLWIFTCGISVEAIVTLLHARTDPQMALMHLFLDVGLGALLMMAGVLIAAKFRRIDFGSLGTTVLRLAAVAVAPDAVNDILSPIVSLIPFAGLGLLAVDFVLYFALLGMFFDLDESDTWYCVCIIFVINVAVYFAMTYLLKGK